MLCGLVECCVFMEGLVVLRVLQLQTLRTLDFRNGFSELPIPSDVRCSDRTVFATGIHI